MAITTRYRHAPEGMVEAERGEFVRVAKHLALVEKHRKVRTRLKEARRALETQALIFQQEMETWKTKK